MATIKCKRSGFNKWGIYIQKNTGEFKFLEHVSFRSMLSLRKRACYWSRTDVRHFVTAHRLKLIERLKKEEKEHRCSII